MSVALIFKNKKFSPLMWTQFLGALNDNILKNAFVVMLTFKGASHWGMSSQALVVLATVAFILPFFLFSALAGQLSDKFEKSFLVRLIKLVEVFIMILAGIGFYLNQYELLFSSIFLMGLHSSFFGPIKYSSLPELLTEEELTAGNAYVEVGTFIAILFGTILGGVLISIPKGEFYILSVLIVVSLLGCISGWRVPKMPIADMGLKLKKNPFSSTWHVLVAAHKNKTVFNSILGISWFWLLGAVILSLLPTITKKIINGDPLIVSLFLAVFTIGIGVGAVLCEKMSFERVEIGLVPWGSLGISIFLVDWAVNLNVWEIDSGKVMLLEFLFKPGASRILWDLFLLAVFGGLFTVPLYTLVQQRSLKSERSQVIGANNIVNAFFMVLGSGLLIFLLNFSISISNILLILAGINLIVSVYIYFLVPEFTLRFAVWIVSHGLYRLKVSGYENLPKEGPAVLVCNHVSFVDWLVISAAIRRPLRFVMYYKFLKLPVANYLMKHAGVIPIAGKNEDPIIFENAFKVLSENLRNGEMVCIFPEGGITPDGELKPFKRGIEHILQKDPVPVVPMALVGLWGSIFSHSGSRAFSKLPKRILFPVYLNIGQALPASDAKANKLQEIVMSLISNQYKD